MEEKKQKQRYIIEVDGIVPVRLRLETWAYDENEALNNLNNNRLCTIKDKPELDLKRLHRRKVSIKDALTSLIKIVKNF